MDQMFFKADPNGHLNSMSGRLWDAGYIKTIMTSLDLTDHVQTM